MGGDYRVVLRLPMQESFTIGVGYIYNITTGIRAAACSWNPSHKGPVAAEEMQRLQAEGIDVSKTSAGWYAVVINSREEDDDEDVPQTAMIFFRGKFFKHCQLLFI